MPKKETGMRLTTNRGRRHKNGTKFGAIHNDRQFDLTHAPHIDQTRTPNNHYWYWCQNDFPGLTFLQAEKKFYSETFTPALDAQNARHIKSRHKERIKTMEDWYTNQNMCPEEMIFQIGNKRTGQPAYEKIQTILDRFVLWSRENYPQVYFLTSGFHADEYSEHFQIRQIYIGHDKDGNPIPAQNQCLIEMGVSLPDPAKKESKYNNRKMTFSKICRDKLFELGKEMGLELVEEPREKGLSGRSIDEVRTEGIRRDKEKAQRELDETKDDILYAKIELSDIISNQEQAEKALEYNQGKLDEKRAEVQDAQRKMDEAMDGLDALVGEYYAAEEMMDCRNEVDRILDFLSEKHPEVLNDWNNREQEIAAFWKDLRAKQSQPRATRQRAGGEYRPEI